MLRIHRVCLCLLAAAATSCGSTSGALVALPFRAGGQAAGPLTFTTQAGWTVTLQTARITLGPFYFNNVPPSTQTFRNGLVIIQVTQQVVLDVLDPALQDVPGGADGQTGHAVAAEIDLFPPGNAQPPGCGLSDEIGLVAGIATKGSVQINFSGPIAFDPCQATSANPSIAQQRVNGAAVDLQFTAQPQALELRVDPTHWFDQVDFSLVTNGTWDVRTPVGQRFLNPLVQGLRLETGVYSFNLVAR
jgi:hypothetical protein